MVRGIIFHPQRFSSFLESFYQQVVNKVDKGLLFLGGALSSRRSPSKISHLGFVQAWLPEYVSMAPFSYGMPSVRLLHL